MRVRQSENEYLCAKSAGPGRPGLITASQQHIDDGAATKLGSSSDCVALVSFDHKFLRWCMAFVLQFVIKIDVDSCI